jgi:outer membrane protein insertion porin family
MHECTTARLQDCANPGVHERYRAASALVHFCILALAFAAPASASVDDYLGKPVASVRLVLDGRDTTEPALMQLVETRAGSLLSMLEVRESVTHLFSLGRFDDVRVDASAEGGGVALRYELSPIHAVSKIEFAGRLEAAGIDVGQLRRALVDRFGTSPPLGRADQLSLAIGDTLREHGYRHPEIRPRVDVDPRSERAALVFNIDPGSRTTLGEITVVGTPAMPQEEFLKRLGLAPGMPFEPDALNARITSYIDARRARGYYQARVTPAVSFADNDRVANLTLTVAPGPHVSVVFSGDPLPSATRATLVPIEREGSADEDLLEDSSNRIEEFLRAQGYRDAMAPHTRQETGGELLITFAVHKGLQYRVGPVEITGDASLPLPDLRASLRTRVGEAYSDANLDADVTAIETVYRGRGFGAAKVQADPRPGAATPDGTQMPVAVSILITEGVRTVVGSVRIEGNASVSETALRQTLSLQPGTPYFDAQLRRDIDAMQLQYANLGYRSATVQAQPDFTPDRAEVNLLFTVREGPRIFVDHILIAGNLRTSAQTIERELQLKPGDPLSLEAEYESQRRLAALQLFRRAPQLTELRHGDETLRDLLVTVEEAAPTTLGYGGGVEGRVRAEPSEIEGGIAGQQFELAPRAFIDLTRRNLFGKNRSINFFGSVSLHPQGFSTTSGVATGLTEYRAFVTFREPRLFDTDIVGLLNVTVEQQIRSSFSFWRRSATAQASRRLTRGVIMSGSYQLQHTRTFDDLVSPEEQPLIDRFFAEERLSSFSVQGAYDTRDEPVDATQGGYLSANFQLAAKAFGSTAGFAKSFFTAQAFRRVPHARGSVFAVQARVGVARGFPREIDVEGQQQQLVTDLPKPERFFAGGDTTVRGFALDTLGRPLTKDAVTGLPIGGNAETIFNVELRGPVRKGIQGVGFVDTGNVFPHTADVDLLLLRTAVGFGLRYKSPVGPIRFDMGFKVHPQRDIIDPNRDEPRKAWFITFGQAF